MFPIPINSLISLLAIFYRLAGGWSRVKKEEIVEIFLVIISVGFYLVPSMTRLLKDILVLLYEFLEPYYEKVLFGLILAFLIFTLIDILLKIKLKIDSNVALTCLLCRRGCGFEDCDNEEAKTMSEDHTYRAPKLLIEDLYIYGNSNILSKFSYFYIHSVPSIDKFWSIVEAFSGLALLHLEHQGVLLNLNSISGSNDVLAESFIKISYVLISLIVLIRIAYNELKIRSTVDLLIAFLITMFSIIIILGFFLRLVKPLQQIVDTTNPQKIPNSVMISMVSYVIMLIVALALKLTRIASVIRLTMLKNSS